LRHAKFLHEKIPRKENFFEKKFLRKSETENFFFANRANEKSKTYSKKKT